MAEVVVGRTSRAPGALDIGALVLRQNPASPNDLYAWFEDLLRGVASRKDVTAALTEANTNTPTSLIEWRLFDVMPYRYSLYLGDDQLPIEDFHYVIGDFDMR